MQECRVRLFMQQPEWPVSMPQSILAHLGYFQNVCKALEIAYCVQFADAKTKSMAKDWQQSNVFSGPSVSTASHDIRIEKWVLDCPIPSWYVGTDGSNLFNVTHLEDATLVPCPNKDALYFQKVAELFLTSSRKLNVISPESHSMPLQLNICGHYGLFTRELGISTHKCSMVVGYRDFSVWWLPIQGPPKIWSWKSF